MRRRRRGEKEENDTKRGQAEEPRRKKSFEILLLCFSVPWVGLACLAYASLGSFGLTEAHAQGPDPPTLFQPPSVLPDKDGQSGHHLPSDQFTGYYSRSSHFSTLTTVCCQHDVPSTSPVLLHIYIQ